MARVLVAPVVGKIWVSALCGLNSSLLSAGYEVVLHEWDLVVVNELRQEPDLPVHLLVAVVSKVEHARADRGLGLGEVS